MDRKLSRIINVSTPNSIAITFYGSKNCFVTGINVDNGLKESVKIH